MDRFLLLSLLAHCALSQDSGVSATSGWDALSPATATFVVILCALFFLAFVISWAALIRFRKGYHVEGRMPFLIWGMQGGFLLWLMYRVATFFVDPPCWLAQFSVFCIFPIFGCFWVRAIRLVFQWEISTKLNDFHSLPQAQKTTQGLYAGRGGFFVRHRRWITPKYLYSAVTVYLVVHFLLCVESGISLCPEIPASRCDFVCFLGYLRLVLLFIIEAVAVLIFVLCHLHKGTDTLMVQIELIAGSVYSVVAVIIAFIFFLFASKEATLIIICLIFTVAACAVIWFPIVLDYRMKRKYELKPPTFTLSTILHDAEGFQSIAAFLKLEFSAENAYFYQRVEEFRVSPNRDGLAEYLYDNFIAARSPFQVNISAPVAAAIAKALNKTNMPTTGRDLFSKAPLKSLHVRTLSSDIDLAVVSRESRSTLSLEDLVSLFDAAQTEVLRLIERDSWVRYLQSVQFANYARYRMKNAHAIVDNVETKMRSYEVSIQRSTPEEGSTYSESK